jgi:hypothetical protein
MLKNSFRLYRRFTATIGTNNSFRTLFRLKESNVSKGMRIAENIL